MANETPQNGNAMPADVQQYLTAQQQGTHTANPAAPATSPAPAPANPNAMPADVQQYLTKNPNANGVGGANTQQTPPPATDQQPGFLDRFEETLGLKGYMEHASQQAALDQQFGAEIEKAVKNHDWGTAIKLAAKRLSSGAFKQAVGSLGPAGEAAIAAPGVAQSTIQHLKNVGANVKSGNYGQASQEVGEAVPIVGEQAKNIAAPTAQDIGNRNWAGLAGDAAGIAPQALLMMLGGDEAEAEQAADAAAKSSLPTRSAADISSGMYSPEADHIAAALGEGSKKINVPHEVNKVLPEIREGVADTGATPKDFQAGQLFGKGAKVSPSEASAARRSAPTVLRRGVNRAIDIHEMRVQPLIDHVSSDVVPPEVLEKNPALKAEFADKLEKGEKITYGDVNSARVRLNKGLGRSNYYGKTPSGQMNVAPNAEQMVQAGNEARDVLYDHVKEQTGVDVRPIKQRESSLIKLHDLAQGRENQLAGQMATHNTTSIPERITNSVKNTFRPHGVVADAENLIPPDFWFNRHVRLGLGDFEPNPVTKNGGLINPPNWGLKLNPPEGNAGPGPGAQEEVPFNEGFSQDMQTSPNADLKLTGEQDVHNTLMPAQRPMPFHENPEAVYPSTEPGGESPAEPRPVTPNGSGESAASQEAINRKASEKANGVSYYKVDTRKPGNKMSLSAEANASDLTPGDHEAIIKVNPDGSEEVMAQGAKAKSLPMKQAQKPAASVKYKTEAEQNAAAKKIMSKQHVSSEMNYFDQAAQEASKKYGKPYHELTSEQRSEVMQRAQALKEAAKAQKGKALRDNLKETLKRADLR